MMNAPVKKKWLKALRSGKYPKGKESLVEMKKDGKTIKGYCCLGVLTDLYIKESPKTRKWGVTAQYSNGGLPLEVQNWAGLDRSIPYVSTRKYETESLSTLNDGDKYSRLRARPFTQIANFIDATF